MGLILGSIYPQPADSGFTLTDTFDNSSQDVTISLGTYGFPNYPSRHPGFLRLTLRENGADSNLFENEWANPIEPPYRVQYGQVLSGDLFTAGSSYLRSVGPNCVNLGNSSRFVASAGVPTTFVGTYLVWFLNSSSGSENICPGTGDPIYSQQFNLNFTFPG